jgi:NADPH2:quinone reductase
MAEMQPKLPFYNLMFKGIKIDTYLIYSINQDLRKKVIEGLSNGLNNDSLKHMISKSFSLDEIVEAHKTMEDGSLIGNIVINI